MVLFLCGHFFGATCLIVCGCDRTHPSTNRATLWVALLESYGQFPHRLVDVLFNGRDSKGIRPTCLCEDKRLKMADVVVVVVLTTVMAEKGGSGA